jgi:IS5 family transposase
LFELLLPSGMRTLSGELAEIDAMLDDRRFFVPFGPFFDPHEGRPSVPIETYLRLMFLKYRYGLGYERLCAEVTDSISWRRFCRIGLEALVPDESTIRKLTRRCGPELIEALNRELLAAAHLRGEVDVARVRVDTTVVEADIKYPTDSGLLTAAVCRIASRLRRLTNAGVKLSFVDRTSAARALQHSIGVWLRRRTDEAKAEVLAITGQLAELAAAAVEEANKVLRYQARKRRIRRMLADLAVLVERTMRVIDQAHARVLGEQPAGATRLVSLHEPDARPIRKGRLGKPVEFGYKAQLVDNEDGVIVDHNIEAGNPPDAPMLEPAIQRIKRRTGRAPRAVTADRGYGEQGVEDAVRAAGARYVVLPTKGRPTTKRRHVENRRAFRKMVRWRTGCEGRISCAKRDFGLSRTRIDGLAGARTWCGHGIFAHNLVKISGLID